jgi:hypothetical protein
MAVLLASLLLSWPAFYNGFPLLFPDSMAYLKDGLEVVRKLLLQDQSVGYSGRSLIYAIGILPFHLNVTPWPIVGLNALLVAYVLFLVVRSFRLRHGLAAYILLVGVLSAVTGLGWFVAFVMPDILGPVLYLIIYLIAFCWETLSPRQRVLVSVIGCWAAASHLTHLLLAVGLCGVVAAVLLVQRRAWLAAIGRMAMIILLAMLSQLAINALIFGTPSLAGEHPPFLLARVIADGPGKWYLSKNCGELRLSICKDLQRLPSDSDDFLWQGDGIWMTASAAEQNRLREDEMTVIYGTLIAYPLEELRISTVNFLRQLRTFEIDMNWTTPWVLEMFDSIIPSSKEQYLASRQVRQTLNEELFNSEQKWSVLASIVIITIGIALFRWTRTPQLAGIASVVLFVVVANAAVTGILSEVDNRYQSRVIWLLPFLASIFVLLLMNGRLTLRLRVSTPCFDAADESGRAKRHPPLKVDDLVPIPSYKQSRR